MTPEQLDQLGAYLLGTCQSVDDGLAALGLSENEDLEEALRDECQVERCACCAWWCEYTELEEVDGEPLCEDCREPEE